MNPVRAMLAAKLRMAWHWVASVRTESRLKVAFVGTSAVALWALAFLFSWGVLEFLERSAGQLFGVAEQGLMDIVLTRLLSTGTLAVFALLTMSNLLVSFATIYRAREVAYLVQAPLSVGQFFLGRFFECIWLSSWALLFVGSPILLAYGGQRGVPFGFYLAVVLFFPVFVLVPAALGAIASTLLVRALAGRSPKIALGALAALALVAIYRARGGLPDFEGVQSMSAIADILGRADHALLPSSWVTRGLLASATGDLGAATFYWLVTAANGLFFAWIALRLAERWFYRGWTALGAADDQRAPSRGGLLGRIDDLLGLLRPPDRALVAKDIRLFWRDPAQWSQFLIFFGLMTLYVANMRSDGGMLADPRFRSWIAVLNMAASMLVLATLTTRFVFPLISLEGRRFWILGLAPLSLRRLVAQKFLLSVTTCSVFTVGIALLTAWRLDLSAFEFGVTVGGVVAAILALSGLAVGLGALYPNFREDNPSRIISGLGGTLNFILSLAFVALMVAVQAFLVGWQRVSQGSGDGPEHLPMLLAVCLAVVATLMTTWIPLRLGLRNLQQIDY